MDPWTLAVIAAVAILIGIGWIDLRMRSLDRDVVRLKRAVDALTEEEDPPLLSDHEPKRLS